MFFRYVFASITGAILCASQGAWAGSQTAETATSTSAEEDSDLLLRLEFEVGLEKGNGVEKGFFHPEATKLFVMDLPLDWLGVFAYAQVGKSRGELYGGAVFRPLSLFLDHPLVHLDLGLGIGMGAGGVPILGAMVRVEEESILFALSGYYHYINGVDLESVFRFRAFPRNHWFVEWWWGAFGHVTGKGHFYDTLEAGPMTALRVRSLFHGLIWLGWPFRRFEKRYDPKFLLGVEVEF